MPVANARSRFGNHSATDLIAAGKLPASPRPSSEPRGDEAGDRGRVGQARTPRGPAPRPAPKRRRLGVRHRREAPDRRSRSTKPSCVPSRSIIRPGEEQADRVGELEREDDVARSRSRVQPNSLLQRRLQDADDLPIDVVDGRGEEQQRADDPARSRPSAAAQPATALVDVRCATSVERDLGRRTLRSSDCADESRTRDGRALRPPSACPTRRPALRRTADRPPSSSVSVSSMIAADVEVDVVGHLPRGARVAGDLDHRRDRDCRSACRARS